MLPAMAGPGRIALGAPTARVVPVFIHGLGNDVGAELRANLFDPRAHPLTVAVGPEVDLGDLRGRGDRAAARLASNRMRDAILALAGRVST
jgi:hypothetical protein